MNKTVNKTVNKTIEIKLFGAFRQVDPSGTMTVSTPDAARVADVRAAVAKQLDGDDNALSLLQSSAFATDERVLDDDDPVPGGELSVLPPVCGG